LTVARIFRVQGRGAVWGEAGAPRGAPSEGALFPIASPRINASSAT
jgi:hypothetical protein